MAKKRGFLNLLLIVFLIFSLIGVCNSSEEKNCGRLEFKCNNGECVHILRKCDTIKDCSDNSDEENCGGLYCDTQTHFLCDNGECISREMVCDGALDCFDDSDEKHCTDEESCPETRHKCENGRCILKEWECDGVEDCEDGDDERNCSNTCPDGYAPCNNGKCLPSYVFCNGQKDCEDNEDETKCGNFTEACLTENGHFLCRDGLKCLKDQLVCDGKTQCNDLSDEGVKCGMPCEDLKPPCSQGCFKTPSGPKCKCKSGYKLPHNSQTCQDIDECKSATQVCDHFCKNTEGSFRCSCADNYYLLDDDNATCRIEGSAMILFSMGYEIIGKMLDGSESWVVSYTDGESPSAITFDPKEKNVYWISDKKKIYMKSLKGREEPKIFMNYGLDHPENLALDWLGRNIYITDYNKSQIVVCNIESKDCFVLMKNLSQPRSLQLELEERYLYFTTISSHKIIKVGMDGEGSEDLINEDIVWPNGLALDYPAKRIYWVDAHFDKIDSSDYNGKNRKGFLIKDASHAYSLAVWQDRIYWTDWEKELKKEIHSCRKRDGMAWKSEYKSEKSEVNNILTYHPSLFETVQNPCENSLRKKCSHICLLSPNNRDGYVCACPKELKLSSDKHYCEELGKFLLVSVQANIYRVPLKYYITPVTTAEKFMKLNAGNIVDMDYSPSKDEIYLADPKSEAISRVSMNDGKATKIIENIRFPTSIAIDWLRDNLYWINGIHHTVEVSRTSGSYRKIIAPQFLSPTDIALDVIKGFIYISDGSLSPTINKCELNGTYCQALVDKNVPKSISLYVDITSKPTKIFWTNPERNMIESIDEHGRNRIVEITDLSNPVRINVNEDFIIWTEKLSNVIHFAPKHTHESKGTTKLDLGEKPKDSWFMALTSAYKKPNVKDPCFESYGKCHQFCFSKTSQNMVCECSQGLSLQPDGTCTTQKCRSDEWMCDNGECIIHLYSCDGSVDCADESDERNCTKQCSENQFRCNDGVCIDKGFKCDDFPDCHDESDEENCPTPNSTCLKNAWQCNSGECLPIPWRCDSKSQCKDGSDEKDCDIVVCSKDKKKCNNGNCIPLTWWCDGQNDCKTGEDEKDCPCKLGQYKCKNGQCLDEEKLCRKEISCGEEELNITCPTLAPNAHKDCPLNFVSCDPLASEIKCIPFEGWCNKTTECPNKEDEKHCECEDDKVKCDGEETCIFREWICDTVEDCVDGSDEKGCFPLVVDVEEEFCSLGFKCSDETCISNDKVCDGFNHCIDGLDESGDCDKCQHNNGGCQQICHNYPTKVKCSCKMGFVLSNDGVTCDDLNECGNEEICQHYCENVKGSFYCTCAEGYTLKEDRFSCKLDKPHSSLIIIRDKELDYYDETLEIRHSPQLLVPKHFSPETKYIYDPVDKKLIGIDGRSGIVYVESSGKWIKEMTSVDDVKDVAFDYINRNIYIVRANIVYKRPSSQFESRKMGSTVQVYNLESKLLGELFVVPDKNITSLIISLVYHEMFTCENDESERGVIMSRNLDGSILGTLVDEKIIYCNSLVIDEFKKRIYWIDEAMNKIESVDFLGADRRRFVSKQIHLPKSLSLLNHHLLWFNPDQNAIVKCSIRDPNNCSELSFAKKSEIFILNRDKIYDLSIRSPCGNLPCHHICVPHLMEIHHCVCAIGYMHKKDNCTLAIDFETGGIPGDCAASPCEFGTCIPLPFGLVSCRCDDGYAGTLCDVALKREDWSSFYLALVLTLVFIGIIIIAAIYCYKNQLCRSFTIKKKNIRFVSPSFVLIEEDSTSQPPTPPILRSTKVYPDLHKQGSQDSNDSAIAIDIP